MTATNVTDPNIHYRTAEGWVDATSGAFTRVEFPTASNVGVAAIDGWEPATVVSGSDQFIVSDEGAVLEDLRIVGPCGITPYVPHVTFRRCEFINCSITTDYGNLIHNGFTLEDCTLRADPVGASLPLNYAVGIAGFTARRCAILDANEGWRTGGSEMPLDDPADPHGYAVRIFDSYCQITGPPDCVEEGIDYHGDALQAVDGGVGGVPLTLRNCVLTSTDISDCGASTIIGAGYLQSNPINADGVILSGAAVSLHAECGGDFRNMYFVDDSWIFYPIDFGVSGWDRVGDWSAWTVELDVDGQPSTRVASFPRGWSTTNAGMGPP